MERALHAAGSKSSRATARTLVERSLAREYPLSPDLLAVSQVWTSPGGDALVASKGAPEAIADLCRLPPDQRAEVAQHAARFASQGLRVLAVARGSAVLSDIPEEHRDLKPEFVGLVGFEDPLRPGVPAAVAECRAAGIRVVMITGDYPATARSIAQQAGLENPDTVVTGRELDEMSDEELARRIGSVQVFARAVPAQKLRLVNALKANKEVVAMTGDGVNDAPALKAAHIGIAMGGRGTDVAREAAALVLLDDDFSSIVAAVRLGRRIFDNIKKAIAFVLAVHLPIAGLSMLPVFFADWPLLLLPVHIAFLELVIDPSCSLVYEAEAEEADVMRKPPRDPNERLFSTRTIVISNLLGLSVLAVCLSVLLLARGGHEVGAARGLVFATLVLAFLAIILVNRSSTRSLFAIVRVRNVAFGVVTAGTLGLLAVVLFVPFARKLFHFSAVHPDDLVLSAVAGLFTVFCFELLKPYVRRAAAQNGGSGGRPGSGDLVR
jgi:Ca2+-transporting ATPase